MSVTNSKLAMPEIDIDAQRIEELIGHTPLVGFNRITAHLPPNVQLFAKAEWANPGGSVKDRPALQIIREAEAAGHLPGKTILDSTSGNTGIAYAMLGAAKGYPVKLFVPGNVSPERTAILRAYDAEVVLTDPLEGSDGAIRAVRALYAKAPESYFYGDQYNNPANWRAHYLTTGVEIWEQTAGRVTHFVAGLGTSGTLIGIGRRLKELNPAIRVVSLQPDSAFHGLEGLKHMPTAIKPGIYDANLADENLGVGTEESYRMVRRLAREEGLMVGISAGTAMVGALKIAEQAAQGGEPAVIVTLFPDNAYKYLSGSPWR